MNANIFSLSYLAGKRIAKAFRKLFTKNFETEIISVEEAAKRFSIPVEEAAKFGKVAIGSIPWRS